MTLYLIQNPIFNDTIPPTLKFHPKISTIWYIDLSKKDYQIHDIVFGLDILDNGFWQNYKPDENINNYVDITARNIAKKYYQMATELIEENYYMD